MTINELNFTLVEGPDAGKSLLDVFVSYLKIRLKMIMFAEVLINSGFSLDLNIFKTSLAFYNQVIPYENQKQFSPLFRAGNLIHFLKSAIYPSEF
jgi:hypothetical protein